MKAEWKNLSATLRGAEIAEAALVLPLVFLILLGIYSFGRAFNVYATINHAARQGARAAIIQTCATCGNVNLNNAATQVGQALLASHSIHPGHTGAAFPTRVRRR